MATAFNRTLAGLAFALAASVALVFPPAHAQTLHKLATSTDEGREQRLIEGAKKEGSLLFYTTTPVEFASLLIEPFEKKYGIKVNVWRSRSELVLQRVLNEARGGNPAADVIVSLSPSIEALHRENLLQEISSRYHKELIPSAVAAHHEWASIQQLVFVQAYNTEKVSKDELPKTYQDLLAPKWKGKLGIEGSDHEWVSSVIKDMGEANGVRFFNELVGSNKLSVRNGHPLLTSLVASGEVPLALTVYQYSIDQAKKKGSPIDWFVIEPAITITNAIAVTKKAPHPHAALLFYEYMLSADAHRILAKIGYFATNSKVAPPIENVKLKILEPTMLLEEHEKSYSRFESILRTK